MIDHKQPTPDDDKPAFMDPQRPNGQALAGATMPGWLESSFRRIHHAINEVVHHDQHEYLENRRLPHALKQTEVLVKPHMLHEGSIITLTAFPVAAETCFVVLFTPYFSDGTRRVAVAPADDAPVQGFDLLVYQERGRFASENIPQTPAPFVRDELIRQAFAFKLRNMQFLYFTILRPQVMSAFEDPNNHFAALQKKMADQAAAINKSNGPTPAFD